jgi:hypothetical protein
MVKVGRISRVMGSRVYKVRGSSSSRRSSGRSTSRGAICGGGSQVVVILGFRGAAMVYWGLEMQQEEVQQWCTGV